MRTFKKPLSIFFYPGFFPGFLDLSAISCVDTGIIVVIAAAGVGGAKLVYAFVADRAGLFIGSKAIRGINIAGGSIMIAAGLFWVAKA